MSRKTANAILMAFIATIFGLWAVWPESLWLSLPAVFVSALAASSVLAALYSRKFFRTQVLPSYWQGCHLPVWADILFYFSVLFSATWVIGTHPSSPLMVLAPFFCIIAWTAQAALDFCSRWVASRTRETEWDNPRD